MSILVDTNVLLRRTQPDHPSHAVAVESVARLLASGEQVCFTLQNIAEAWNVATRPIQNNGFGFSVPMALAQVDYIERSLRLLPEAAAIYPEWKRLIVKHNVLGVNVHDTRLVAAMNVHGIGKILTFDVGDFSRFDVATVPPSSVMA